MREDRNTGSAPQHFKTRQPRFTTDDDGTIRLWDDLPVIPEERSLAHLFAARAAQIPERILIAKREGGGEWAAASYKDMIGRARRISNGLLGRGLKRGDRILCLSGESVDHLALQLGAMLAGLVTVPISVRYSTANDRGRLDHVLDLIKPALTFAKASPAMDAALAHCTRTGCPTLTTGPSGLGGLEQNSGPIDLHAALDEIGPDTIYRILLTSGSTAKPKGVLQTHGMSCASLSFEASLTNAPAGLQPPAIELSWLPWSHVGGGVTVFNNILYAGRSLYLDGGRPVQGLFEETVRNLKELMPSEFASPPAGLVMLVPELEKDDDFRAQFLQRLRFIKSGAAAMPDAFARRFQNMAVETTGHEIPIFSGYGSTETHGVVSLTWPCDKVRALGLPKPGVQLKLVPEGDRFEIRVRSESVTPGYYDAPENTKRAFDDEGFFRTGDMAKFDPEQPMEGLFFAGRSVENFKMATGTWVLAEQLRMALLDTLEGLVKECLVVGEGYPELGLMIWANIADREQIAARVRAFNADASGASQRVMRLIFSDAPIQEDRFERTEKGSLNRNRILDFRQQEIDRLYASNADRDECVVLFYAETTSPG